VRLPGFTYPVVHCESEAQARFVLDRIKERMQECKLELHPVKTKIVYCKDKDRQGGYDNTEFDFLGYTFKSTIIRDRTGRIQRNFLASVSKGSCQALRDKIKKFEIHKMSGSKIEMIAELVNPIVRGWMNYFGAYNKSAMKSTLDCVQRRLIRWAMCKYKRFRGKRRLAEDWLEVVRKREPRLFAHWTLSKCIG
jgi:RNA-directed DNA polymerase